ARTDRSGRGPPSSAPRAPVVHASGSSKSVVELALLRNGGDMDEPEVLAGRTGEERGDLVVSRGVGLPGPDDDRDLLVEAEEVAPPLPVAVPQLLSSHLPREGPPHDARHHRAPREVVEHDGVGTRHEDRGDLSIVPA